MQAAESVVAGRAVHDGSLCCGVGKEGGQGRQVVAWPLHSAVFWADGYCGAPTEAQSNGGRREREGALWPPLRRCVQGVCFPLHH